MRLRGGATVSKSGGKDIFKVRHINAGRLNCRAHHSLIRHHCLERDLDALAVSETFFGENDVDEMGNSPYGISGYKLVHVNRVFREGGGVALFVKDKYSLKVLHKSEELEPQPGEFDNEPQFLVAELTSPTTKVVVAVIYRRPSAGLMPRKMFNVMEALLPHYRTVIITGDFNINLVSQSASRHFLINSATSNNFLIVPSNATHHTFPMNGLSTHTWIDIFILNCLQNLIYYRKSDAPFIQGHDFIEIGVRCPRTPEIKQKITTRQLRTVTDERIREELDLHLHPHRLHPLLRQSSSPEVLEIGGTTHLDAATRNLTASLINAYDAAAPLRTVTLSTKRRPWVSNDTRALMRIRDRTFHTAIKLKSQTLYQDFKQLRSRVSNDIDTARNKYIADGLDDGSDANSKWRALRRLNLTKSKMPSPFASFTAQELNSHFASIVNSHPPLQMQHLHTTLNSIQLLPNTPTFDLEKVSEYTIKNIISAAASKGTGVDGITAIMLKRALPTALPSITRLLNASLAEGVFPSEWKRALLVPLLKKPTPTSISDTRPIAQLPETSKVLERVVHMQFSRYLEANHLLNPRQAGFRQDHSTQTALLGVIEDIRFAMEKGHVSLLLFLDFSKAFDTIPHDLLLQKLRKLRVGDRTLQWFYSYLADRLQAVIDDGGRISDWLRADSGVPQGSVLGPLLFSIYIDDLPSVLRWSNYMMYADDTQLYIHCHPNDVEAAVERLSLDAQAVADWARERGLSLNVRKTKVMLLGSQFFTTLERLRPENLPPVKINGVAVDYVSDFKNLGVWFTPTLNWNLHTKNTLKKIYACLYALNAYKHAMAKKLRKHLVEALIFPRFDYSCVVFLDLDKDRTLKMQRALNACVRFVVGYMPMFAHVTPHRLQLGWLRPEQRRMYFLAILAFKVVAQGKPDYLTSRFSIIGRDNEVCRSGRRPPEALHHPKVTTQAGRRSFTARAADVLNRLHLVDFDIQLLHSV